MRIAICDDSREERARLSAMLKEYCASHGIDAECDEYDSGEALLGAFSPDAYSLVFMDIYMDGMTGLAAAKSLKSADPGCTVIFTTTSREHGADAFDLDAFYYLVKPIEKEKLFSVMGRWYDALCAVRTISLKCGRAAHELFVRDILYIDVQGRVCTVHTASETVESPMSLSAIEALLPADEFVRPIRYCLVSLRHIRSVRDDGVLLDSGARLPLSRLEKEGIRQQLAAYRLRALRGR